MDKLNTPFGDIIVKINNQEIEYHYKKCDNDRTCPNLLGRYLIEIELNPKECKKYCISCEVSDSYLLKSEIETGEMLECQSFYSQDRVKLSIGVYGECWGYGYNGIYKTNDYDIKYLPSGISYLVLENTKTNKFYFAISWIDDVGYDDPINNEHDRDSETWFGSDPIYVI